MEHSKSVAGVLSYLRFLALLVLALLVLGLLGLVSSVGTGYARSVNIVTATPTPVVCFTIYDSITNADPVRAGMLVQTNNPTQCEWYPTQPPLADTEGRHTKIYNYYFPFGSFSTQCVTVTLTPAGCPGNLFSLAYGYGGFRGDIGTAVQGSGTYSFIVFRGTTFSIIVHEVTPDSGCSAYTLTVSSDIGCSITTQTPTPTSTPTSTPWVGPPTATATTCPPGSLDPWVLRAPQPSALFSSTAASDGTVVYVAGGSSDGTFPSDLLRSYNPATNNWTTLAPMPYNSARASAVYAPNVNRLFVFGGDSLIGGSTYHLTRIYNPETNSWTLGTPMPGGRWGMAAGYYNGKIYLAGGLDGATYLNSVTTWEYDPVANSWSTNRMNMPSGVKRSGSAIINGHLYVAGGVNNSDNVLDSLYSYDISGDTWAIRDSLPTALESPGSVALGGKLWIFGGETAFDVALSSTSIFEPATDTWTAGPNLNVARGNIAGAVVGNTVVAVGGFNAPLHTIYDTTETNTVPGQCVTPTVTSTPVATATATRPPVTSTRTATHPPATSTTARTPVATVTSTPCVITFTDVPVDHPFYANIRCLACRGILGGYADGTFHPGNDITRGQIAKVVSNAAGLTSTPTTETYEDVPPSHTFYEWVERLTSQGVIGGYPCGQLPSEPCNPPGNRPYFRPQHNATRGQLSKIVAEAADVGGTPTGQTYTDVLPDHPFYLWIERLSALGGMGGYACGGPREPCLPPLNRPYFRPYNNVTRGQSAKIVANTFFPNCSTLSVSGNTPIP